MHHTGIFSSNLFYIKMRLKSFFLTEYNHICTKAVIQVALEFSLSALLLNHP